MSMAALTDHLLTLDEWDALPEDNSRHYELVEGVLQVSPRPVVSHQRVLKRLLLQLDRQLPDSLEVLPEIEATIFAAFPPTVRAPDLVVVPAALARSNLPRCTAADALLVVEIASPGTARTDRITKLAEYADAGVPSYWRVDLDPEPRLTVHELEDGSYTTVASDTGRVTVTSPAELTIDVGALAG